MNKKVRRQNPRVLVIEDESGKNTPYYPGMIWNSLGYSFPWELNGTPTREKDQMSLPHWDFFPQKTRENDQSFMDIDRLQKIYSVKNFLRHISRGYVPVERDLPCDADRRIPDEKAYLHSHLMYLIAATDGNEDTLGHSQLVARYTLLLTKALGIDDKTFAVDMERGALLHDIGKIGIPDSILRKPGSLSGNEREIIKEHPFLGYEMVEEFPFLHRASRVVLFHHESYDGAGYPYGLRGEEIPLEARIFTIADALDAITSDRPYRKGKSFRAAFDEIERVRGTQFDPTIVDAFLSVPEEKWLQVKRETERFLSHPTIH